MMAVSLPLMVNADEGPRGHATAADYDGRIHMLRSIDDQVRLASELTVLLDNGCLRIVRPRATTYRTTN